MQSMYRLFAGLLISVLFVPAARADEGFYLRFGGGVGYIDEDVFSDIDFDLGYTGSAAIGYNWFFPANVADFRMELEAVYHDTETNSIGLFPLDGNAQVYGGMVNAYFDFRTNWVVVPHIGGGVGWVRVNFEDDGSGGTLACGDYMKDQFPTSKIAASEALQCPTLLENGFGAHRIEGIGDKHVPWIHNVKNTDMVVAIDDNASIGIMRLFNEQVGQEYLVEQGVSADLVEQLPLLGISSIANIQAAIKMAKYYELGENDVVMTVATDSMEMYESRITEYQESEGKFTRLDAAARFARYMQGLSTDNLQELTYADRKRVHNLKYFTWVEQQGKTYEEIQAQWYDDDYWNSIKGHIDELDELIDQFNARTGLLDEL